MHNTLVHALGQGPQGPGTQTRRGPGPGTGPAKRSLVYTQEILLCIHNYAKLCETMRDYAKLYDTMRNYAKLCETMQNYAKLYETIRNYAKLCETMRNYENWTPNSEQMCLFARACA